MIINPGPTLLRRVRQNRGRKQSWFEIGYGDSPLSGQKIMGRTSSNAMTSRLMICSGLKSRMFWVKRTALSMGPFNEPILNIDSTLYISLNSPTSKEEKIVKIPRPMIPVWKFKWSAITPRKKGAIPVPKIMPLEIIIPVANERSERGVNFEIAAVATGKKVQERLTWKMRAMSINERLDTSDRPMVLSPVVMMLIIRIFLNP